MPKIQLASMATSSLNVCLTLMHSQRPKVYGVLAFLSAVGLKIPVLIQGKLEAAKERVGLQL